MGAWQLSMCILLFACGTPHSDTRGYQARSAGSGLFIYIQIPNVLHRYYQHLTFPHIILNITAIRSSHCIGHLLTSGACKLTFVLYDSTHQIHSLFEALILAMIHLRTLPCGEILSRKNTIQKKETLHSIKSSIFASNMQFKNSHSQAKLREGDS